MRALKSYLTGAAAIAFITSGCSGCNGSRHLPAPTETSDKVTPFVTTYCRTREPTPPDSSTITIGALSLPTMADLGDNPPSPDARKVTFYKGGIEIRGDHPRVTIAIDPAARPYARIDTESNQDPDGAAAVTYAGKPRIDAEQTWTCWYVGGYNLLGGRTTACLPLDVTFDADPVVHYVTVPIGRKCQE